MESQNRRDEEFQLLISRALSALALGVLLLSLKLETCKTVHGISVYQFMGLISACFAFVILISAIGLFIKRNKYLDWLFSSIEKLARLSWDAFVYGGIAGAFSSWVNGFNNIPKDSWIKQPYMWIVPLWIVICLIILTTYNALRTGHNLKSNGWRVNVHDLALYLAPICGIAGVVLIFLQPCHIQTKYLISTIVLIVLGAVFLLIALIINWQRIKTKKHVKPQEQ